MAYIKDGMYFGGECRGKDEDRDRDKDKDFCFAAKHPKAKKILLECGNNPQDAIFEIDDEEVEEDQTFVLDRVIVDTTCLCRPLVKIEFSSLVFFEAESEDEDEDEAEIKVDLLFELKRVCKDREETLQSWRYLKGFEIEDDDELEIEISEPFTVTFCDRACSDCCEYKMTVTGQDFEGEFDALRVVKPDLSALAQGLCDD